MRVECLFPYATNGWSLLTPSGRALAYGWALETLPNGQSILWPANEPLPSEKQIKEKVISQHSYLSRQAHLGLRTDGALQKSPQYW